MITAVSTFLALLIGGFLCRAGAIDLELFEELYDSIHQNWDSFKFDGNILRLVELKEKIQDFIY